MTVTESRLGRREGGREEVGRDGSVVRVRRHRQSNIFMLIPLSYPCVIYSVRFEDANVLLLVCLTSSPSVPATLAIYVYIYIHYYYCICYINKTIFSHNLCLM